MNAIPFDPERDLAPIPFDEQICQLGATLKEQGLQWQPHVGCFVWDPDGFIEAPSPFPNRIYFILSMPRFLEIFGSVENMVDKLVWLPTWEQATTLCRRLGMQNGRLATDIYDLYYRISAGIISGRREKELCRIAINSELGNLSDLPEELASRIRLVYQEFVPAYLDMLRQKDRKPDGWFPDKWSLDVGLLDDMRHFFSDHQFITRKFVFLNTGVRRLRKINKQEQPNRYKEAVDRLLQKPNRNIFAEIGFENAE